jgi:hypothetical protein
MERMQHMTPPQPFCAALAVSIRDTAPLFASPLAYGPVRSTLRMDLPDQGFMDSLDAQVAHLMMGFVGRQTCPGEPTNYPLAWERDGAYSVMAMARCGQLETARQLAAYFAENDHFGGFGAEGDAPGSTIQAIASVALITGDEEFGRGIWPHVQRKVALIEEMLGAKEPVRRSWLGPIVPCHQGKEGLPVVCKAANDGLVVGSMDLHYPVLWSNQCSPGLYSYWEGDGEENAFKEWVNLRGWVVPPHVTPHYWTAAEMLLLQLDMLAYVDESKPQPVLVVGGGVPTEWVGKPMAVSGLQTILGSVDWSWDGRTRLDVVWRGAAAHPARAGVSFGRDVELVVRHEPTTR